MKKILFFLLFFLFLVLPKDVFAFEMRKGDDVLLGEEEVIDGNFFVAGSNVKIKGQVDGDAFVAGRNVFVEGVINGDLIIAGENLNISGQINGDIRSAGASTVLTGNVTKNITAFGDYFIVRNEASVGGHFSFAGNSVEIFGPINGEVILRSEKVLLNSSVGKNFDSSNSGKLVLMDDAEIKGDLNYKSWQKGEISDEAMVAGNVNFSLLKQNNVGSKWSNVSFWMSKLYGLLSLLLVGVILLYFMRKPTEKLKKEMEKNTWRNVGIGFLFLIFTPFICFLLIVSIIGLPIGLILLVFYFIFIYLSKVFGAIYLGGILEKYLKLKDINKYLSLVLGGLFLSLISLIPFFGFVFMFFLMLWALGAGYRVDMEMIKKWK